MKPLSYRASAILVALLSTSASAGDMPPSAPKALATCLMPLNIGDPDPLVRDVHFVVDAAKTALSVSMCVVSNEKRPLSYYAATIGLFLDNGALIEDSGNTYHNIPPMSGGGVGQPSIVLIYNLNLELEPKYAGHLLNQTVIQAAWAFCKAGPPAACQDDSVQTGSFLLPVILDQQTTQAKKGH
jgi:hypothetical protein